MWQGVEIVNPNFIAHVLYVKPADFRLHQKVQQGDIIGYAQNIKAKYPNDPEMKNHVHVNLYVNMEVFL